MPGAPQHHRTRSKRKSAQTPAAAGVAPTTGGVVPPGVVRMQAVNSRIAVDAWVNGPVLPGETGYGGWSVIPREGDTGLVEYTGPEPKRWTLPILIDGWSEDRDIEAEYDYVLEMAEERDGEQPEPVWFWGWVPHGLRAHPYLVEKVTPEPQILISRTDNERRRAAFTLGLIAPSFGVTAESPLKQAQRSAAGEKARRRIRARAGDTLVSIAARELGDPSQWQQISALNHRLQPDNVKAGQLIWLP